MYKGILIACILSCLAVPVMADFSGSTQLSGPYGNNAMLYFDVQQTGSRVSYDYLIQLCDGEEYGLQLTSATNQVSCNFTASDIFNETSVHGAPGWQTLDSMSMKGIEWPIPPDSTCFYIGFESDRLPMWNYNDFWAEGTFQCPCTGQLVDLYWTNQCGPVPVPDTNVVPLPGAVILGSLGLATVGALRRRMIQ
jgi:hypothetical protein